MQRSIRQATFLVAVATMTIASHAHAQATTTAAPTDPAKVAVIRELLKEVHAVDLAVTAMETSLPAQKASNPRIPAVFWDRFMSTAHNRVGQLEDLLLVIYDRHFSTEELRQLLAFYRSPIGRKLLAQQPMVLRESMLAGQEWGQRIGMEVAEQLQAEGVRISP